MSKHRFAFCAVGILAGCFFADIARGSPSVGVNAGYDLFQTDSGTNFLGTPLIGVPIGSFNFGGSIGTLSTGETDTIVQRTTSANPSSLPGSASASLLMQDLQLESVTPTVFGALNLPLNIYFVTLQSARGGTASTGTINVNFATGAGGTFDSSLDVFFDIRAGALNGPILFSSDSLLSETGIAWQRTPADPAALVANGVNQNLNTLSTGNDFWPGVTANAQFTYSGTGATHVVSNAEVPEPVSAAILVLGTAGIAMRRRAAR